MTLIRVSSSWRPRPRRPRGATTLPQDARSGLGLDLVTLLCRAHGLPEPQTEYRFDAVRKWRFDWCWPDRFVALEQNGGVWSQGRHTRGSGYLRDLEKLNMAQLAGWIVLQATPEQVAKGSILPWLQQALT